MTFDREMKAIEADMESEYKEFMDEDMKMLDELLPRPLGGKPMSKEEVRADYPGNDPMLHLQRFNEYVSQYGPFHGVMAYKRWVKEASG